MQNGKIVNGELESMYSIVVYDINKNTTLGTLISKTHIKRIVHFIQSCSALNNTDQLSPM